MSYLLESLLDATRRADCAANDLAFGCSRTSQEAREYHVETFIATQQQRGLAAQGQSATVKQETQEWRPASPWPAWRRFFARCVGRN